MKNLNNLPPFYVGQKIVYITGTSLPKDSIHTVKRIFVSKCGCVNIDIGKSSHIGNNGCNCHSSIIEISSTDWFMASSFRPLQESVFPSLTMSKVLEKESQLISMN